MRVSWAEWAAELTMAKRYQDIQAWRLAMAFAQRVNSVTSRMPLDERFGLTMQIRRAAASVPSNIAVGFGRYSRVEFPRFQRMARGLLVEDLAQADRVLRAFIRGLQESVVPAD